MNKLLKVACMLAASTVFAANAQDLRLGVEPGAVPVTCWCMIYN